MALLCAFDDSLDSGETVRIRVPSFVIGRVEGNLVIPHDGGMSGRHAEIARRFVDGRYRWSLRDLGSTNGTFVRTARALLRDGQELFIGGMRYRFDGPGEAAGPMPRLVEVKPHGEGPAFPLTGPEAWIGRDPRQCTLVFDRPLVSPRHAVIQARRRGHWIIQHAGSCDGLWLRVQEIELGRGGQFQCGEQRFWIQIL
jgi:pSer/pThr/pTyr-binding forkhead associated (FHA) protein